MICKVRNRNIKSLVEMTLVVPNAEAIAELLAKSLVEAVEQCIETLTKSKHQNKLQSKVPASGPKPQNMRSGLED